MTFTYGTIHNPSCPGPEAEIIVSNPYDLSKTITIPAIVDSAAVKTCIPETEVDRLGGLIYDTVKVRDANGNTIKRYTYIVDIQLGEYRFNNVEVVALPRNYALIGRDILNQSKIMLHADRKIWVYDCTVICPLIEDE